MKKPKEKIKKGFSMIESLLAVFILSFGIVAVMSLLVSSMKNSMASRDTIIATELAQEGLELVRNVRDNNVSNGTADFNGITNDNDCRVSYDNALVCNQTIYSLNYSSGFYSYTGGSATKFQRKIIIANYDVPVGAPVEGRIVKSTVAWGGSFPASCTAANKCTIAQSILTTR